MCPVDVTLVQCQSLYVCITRDAAVLQREKNINFSWDTHAHIHTNLL